MQPWRSLKQKTPHRFHFVYLRGFDTHSSISTIAIRYSLVIDVQTAIEWCVKKLVSPLEKKKKEKVNKQHTYSRHFHDSFVFSVSLNLHQDYVTLITQLDHIFEKKVADFLLKMKMILINLLSKDSRRASFADRFHRFSDKEKIFSFNHYSQSFECLDIWFICLLSWKTMFFGMLAHTYKHTRFLIYAHFPSTWG